MVFKNYKKSIVPVISIMLILIVVVSGTYVVGNWFSKFQSDWNSKMELKSSSGQIKILGIEKIDSSSLKLGLKNTGSGYIIIDKVLLNNNNCNLLYSNIVENIEPIYLNCSIIKGVNYNIDVFTNKGIFSKTTSIN